MGALTFDTLKLARKLEQAGFSAQQAEAFADTLKDALATSDVTTKSDLREPAVELRGEMRDLELRIIKWVIGLAVAQIALLIGILVKLL